MLTALYNHTNSNNHPTQRSDSTQTHRRDSRLAITIPTPTHHAAISLGSARVTAPSSDTRHTSQACRDSRLAITIIPPTHHRLHSGSHPQGGQRDHSHQRAMHHLLLNELKGFISSTIGQQSPQNSLTFRVCFSGCCHSARFGRVFLFRRVRSSAVVKCRGVIVACVTACDGFWCVQAFEKACEALVIARFVKFVDGF